MGEEKVVLKSLNMKNVEYKKQGFFCTTISLLPSYYRKIDDLC